MNECKETGGLIVIEIGMGEAGPSSNRPCLGMGTVVLEEAGNDTPLEHGNA